MKIENGISKTTKQIVAMNENEEITFRSISEGSKFEYPTKYNSTLFKNGKCHPAGYQFKYCC